MSKQPFTHLFMEKVSDRNSSNQIRVPLIIIINFQKYRLVLTGHSLGAAVASVLAVLFKDSQPEYTHHLQAFTFSTPGAVLE